MDKENILYYQSNIKTSRDEDRVYAMKYANQQMLIDKLEQQCKKQKEVINKITDLIKQYGKYDGEKCTRGFQMWSADFNKILDMLKEVSE